MRHAGIAGEVVVADNGSTDDSPAIARAEGARLVPVADRGYGAALMGGIEAAHGRFVIMGDADDSYDFGEVPKFVERLREGYDLVQGCRLESGGGRVLPGAMPRLHRWLGNPMFSRIARRWFRAPVHDIYCGLRGFTKALYQTLDQRCTGMEFATEMIIKASLLGARIGEVPITLHPDGRKSHPPHLKTFRDGWRTLRFFLMCTPRRLFLMPGLILVVLGIAGFTVAMPGMTIGRMTFDAHTLLFASLAVICGSQSMLLRAHREDVRDHGRRAAARSAHRQIRADPPARTRLAPGIGHRPSWRRHARLRRQRVARPRFRPPELRRDDAGGRAGRDAGRARVPDDSLVLFPEPAEHAAALNEVGVRRLRRETTTAR